MSEEIEKQVLQAVLNHGSIEDSKSWAAERNIDIEVLDGVLKRLNSYGIYIFINFYYTIIAP